jgi:hypothetical protein
LWRTINPIFDLMRRLYIAKVFDIARDHNMISGKRHGRNHQIDIAF